MTVEEGIVDGRDARRALLAGLADAASPPVAEGSSDRFFGLLAGEEAMVIVCCGGRYDEKIRVVFKCCFEIGLAPTVAAHRAIMH
jgi:hypothetical protein